METITQPNLSLQDNSNSNGHAEKEDKEINKTVDDPKTMSVNGKDHVRIIQPHWQLPKPEAPPGISTSPPHPPPPLQPPSEDENMKPWIGDLIRIRSNRFSTAIVKKLSTFKEVPLDEVTQINMSGVKVIVKTKSESEREEDEVKGRISFFSRSNCRDCTAVRTFFREKRLKFVEINIDVYREREKELVERCGSKQVPQIFFNDKLLGGLVALNSLRNSGEFDKRLRDLMEKKCYSDPPAPPLYGFDDDHHDDQSTDDMLHIITLLRQKLPIQDRFIKLKILRNCFSADDMLHLIIHHLDCDRSKAIEIGKRLSRKHFIHHVFGENEFEEGNHFFRFLEHEPDISSCYNFRGNTNDNEPKAAVMVGQRLAKIMSAILESYASDDRTYVDYAAIAKSEEFRRYVNVIQDLHRVNINAMSGDEKLAFFLNLHNAMVIHAIIRIGHPEGVMDRKAFFSDFEYVVGGYNYSISSIQNGILRNNRRGPYSLVKPFSTGDKRLEVTVEKVNPLIHFGLCKGTKSSPRVRFFTPQGVEAELRFAAREFFQNGGMDINLEKRTLYLTRIIKWFSADFAQEKEIPRWLINYLDATKAGLLTHLMDDGGPIHIVYQKYDWSPNF